ncbi:MAG: nuclease A inhibitor family protein [Gemmatimonadaceae bacterium]
MPSNADAVRDALTRESAGLIYMSEADSTFTVVSYPWVGGTPLTLEAFRACIGAPADAPGFQVSLDRFFAPAIEHGSPDDPLIQKQKPGFVQLKATLQQLKAATVLKIGKSDIQAYAVGLASPTELAGVSARVVET